MRYKKLVTHVESPMSAVRLLESGEQSYIKAINNNNNSIPPVNNGAVIIVVRTDTRGTVTIIIIDRFYTALFSALEQTHCACMWFYMSE